MCLKFDTKTKTNEDYKKINEGNKIILKKISDFLDF